MLCYFDRMVIQAREINENPLNAVPFASAPRDCGRSVQQQSLIGFMLVIKFFPVFKFYFSQ